uniref:Large ribosomal subunit protein bL32c n=3 Tax=Membranoptera TaxID=158697 RepID=A0A1L1Y9Y9_9FLOR|nr:ribosomal protein L32 [Membranoptera platyphylla]YP_009332592.1 ribosomal protein L32 [Membranoptera weeksiae]YP_009332812.1 ribosomal protein L32 [Membranoptera tenuis]AHZ94606.1 ribosomal protein L32 [Membranoptera weeksiae]AKL79068.1 ribosomal protein L32 [Membranoptera tenuis]AMJ16849.1 ribosomal protein L32 [Membranoptera platyphylla]
MAVPKKRTSKSKSKKAHWKRKALFVSQKSISLAKSILSDNPDSFIYLNDKSELKS